jgi:cell division protein FtsW (lipid II flippase)
MPIVTFLVVKLFSKLWPIDRALLILTLFLCSISLVTLKDIARSSVTPLNQALYVLAGLVAMALGIGIIRHVRTWDKWALPLAAVTFLAVASPLVIGSWQYGAKNWLDIAGISVQPSEFGKLALIFVLASQLSNRPRFRRCLPSLIFAAALCALLLAERDLGALLLYFLTTVMMFYAATSNLPITLAGLGMGVGGALVAYRLFPYVAKRFEMFQNPWSDPLDAGWQIIQALIAIGSGGMFGMGLGLGYPRNIPLYHSDFVFAAICEEFGLIFALAMLGIYVLILMRGASVAMNARTSFHALVAFGVVALIAAQTFVIVGGNIKLIPLTGVTLPFVSAGGSSMVSMMGGMGMLLGVSSLNAGDEAEDLRRLEWREGVL